ncbi:hypothetical protein U9M48_043666, partial [Paspalum notatum var. saurae]
MIAELLLTDDLTEYVRFRAVCTTWRQCTIDPRDCCFWDSRFHPRRWTILKVDDDAAPHRRRFKNVATEECIDLPEMQGRCAFGPTAEGLLVLVDERTLVVSVLNPFTRQRTELPSLATLLLVNWFKKCLFARKKPPKTCYAGDLAHGYLSVGAACLVGECMVALHFSKNRYSSVLAVAMAGGERWMVVPRDIVLTSLLTFEGRLYCLRGNDIMTMKTSENQPPSLVVAAKLPQDPLWVHTRRLVENGRELILVQEGDGFMDKKKYQAHRVDLEAKET